MSVVVLFGVCGCGKTTVGRALSEKLKCRFADADEWHPQANVDKMSRGVPLTDQDRLPWLHRLHELMSGWCEDAPSLGVIGILACSALKRSYRDILSGVPCASGSQGSSSSRPSTAVLSKHSVLFVLLRASERELQRRVVSREEHFMPATLIDSQLEALEPPLEEEELTVAIETDDCGIDDIVMKIIEKLKNMNIIKKDIK